MKKLSRSAFLLLVGVAAAALLLVMVLTRDPAPTELTFTELETKISNGEIAEATILDRSHEIEAILIADDEPFIASFPAEATDELFAELRAAEPPITLDTDPQDTSLWVQLLFNLLPILLLVGIFLFFINSMQGGGRGVMSFGKAKTRKPRRISDGDVR